MTQRTGPIPGVRSAETSNAPTSPALVVPETKSEVDVPLGKAAPSDAPAMESLSAASIKALIAEQVEEQVAERMRALEQDDPSKEDFTQEDQQFSNFDKKLEVFGIDWDKTCPGFVLRWVNDDGDRVPRLQMMGYEFVKRTEVGLNEKLTPLNQDLGENIAVYVGKNTEGGAMRAFLMKIPKELFDKRQAAQQRVNDKIEHAIRHGGIGPALGQGGYAGTDGPQGPGSGVKIQYTPQSGRNMGRPPST